MLNKKPLQSAQPSGALVPVRPAARITFTPRVDILENDEELILLADVPGVKLEDMEVRFEKGELTLHGRCPARAYTPRSLGGEYDVGDFYRVFSLSEHLDSTRITAELVQGVLTVRLPKTEAAKPKRIAVQGG